jgi:hypothetical protein
MQKKKNWRRDAEDQTRYGAKHDEDFVPDEVYGKWEFGGHPWHGTRGRSSTACAASGNSKIGAIGRSMHGRRCAGACSEWELKAGAHGHKDQRKSRMAQACSR